MVDLNEHHQPPVHILAGVLAHLSQYMENGCPRSAYLAALLLEQIATAPETDAHLSRHALQLVETLEKAPYPPQDDDMSPKLRVRSGNCQQSIRKCAP
jgi:hypothetical protein